MPPLAVRRLQSRQPLLQLRLVLGRHAAMLLVNQFQVALRLCNGLVDLPRPQREATRAMIAATKSTGMGVICASASAPSKA